MNEIHNIFDIIEEKITKLENGPKESFILKHRGKHDWKNNEQSLHELSTQ